MRLALHLRQRQQQVLGGDVLILQPVGFLLRLREHVLESRGPCRVCVPVALRQAVELAVRRSAGSAPRSRRSSGAAAGRRPPFSASSAAEQVQRQDLRMVPLLRQLLRPDDGFLCFDGELIESHVCLPWPMAQALPRPMHRDKRQTQNRGHVFAALAICFKSLQFMGLRIPTRAQSG